MKRRLSAIVVVSLMFASSAAADDPPGGGWCGKGVCGGGTVGGDGGPSPTSPLYWRRTLGFDPVACQSTPDGAQWRYRLWDSRLHDVVTRYVECADPQVPDPPLPPLPPSPYEVWGAAPVPVPEVRINPHGDGLVGLPVWLWYDQATTQSLTVAAPPFWSLTIDVGIVGYRWDLGNGDTATGTVPGSEAAPSAIYTYEHDCACAVTATAIWGGRYTVTGPDFEPFTVELGTREFTGPPHDFPVHEVQAVGDNG